MGKKITYLLGAGASALALPLIKNIEVDTERFPEYRILPSKSILHGLPRELSTFVTQNEINFKYVPRDNGVKDSSISFEKLAIECINFGTPDLFAKYLLERGDETNYRKLRLLLANYFTYKQDVGGAFDKRTLAFLTTISSKGKFPDNVKILSWNYDKQMEIAAKKLAPHNSDESQFLKDFVTWPNIPNAQYSGSYSLVHLNGVAGYNYHVNNLAVESKSFYNFDDTNEPLISFAWEKEDYIYKRTFSENRKKIALDLALGTDILVIIGYSFPFFNREIDKDLFEAMSKTLKKIYFQDPVLNGDFLYDQFDLPSKNDIYALGGRNRQIISIAHISNVEQYFIPYEL